MPQKDHDKIMLAEHILEVRHDASGTFLDVRGFIADFIRREKFLPHWKIDANVVNFRDQPDRISAEGAFIGYKSAGYIVLNPQTRNFFPDRGGAFWKLLARNEHYKLPRLTRFGMRTKVFIPSSSSFETINADVYAKLFSETARTLLGGSETDLHFTVDLKESGLDVRVQGGPIHKGEAAQHLQFEADEFERCGLLLDLDYHTTAKLTVDEIPKLLRKATNMMWIKAESIATGLGL